MDTTRVERPVHTKRVNRGADATRSSRLIVRLVQPIASDPAETARRLREVVDIALAVRPIGSATVSTQAASPARLPGAPPTRTEEAGAGHA